MAKINPSKGLKENLIIATVEAAKLSGLKEEDLDTSAGSAIETQSRLIVDSFINFLSQCEFRVTKLQAPVILENLKIPPQSADISPNVNYISPSGVPSPLNNILDGVITKPINVDKSEGQTGILDSTGYVFIGEDPSSQKLFDVSDENGQKDFTTVKFFIDDNEGLF